MKKENRTQNDYQLTTEGWVGQKALDLSKDLKIDMSTIPAVDRVIIKQDRLVGKVDTQNKQQTNNTENKEVNNDN